MRPSKRSRTCVAAIWFTAPATSFLRPRGLSRIRQPTPECQRLPWASRPLQGPTGWAPPEPFGFQQPSWDFAPLQRHQHGRSSRAGFPVPAPSVFRVSTLLTVCSPPRLLAHGTSATHGVHPAERFPSMEPYAFRRLCPLAVSGIACSCSEDQEFTMPRSSRALLSTEIRTCLGPRPAQAAALMGVFAPLQSDPRAARIRLPGPVLPALRLPDLREAGQTTLQGTSTRAGRRTPRGTHQLS
jgi:hypothetical protein